jgi:hypothetical protein
MTAERLSGQALCSAKYMTLGIRPQAIGYTRRLEQGRGERERPRRTGKRVRRGLTCLVGPGFRHNLARPLHGWFPCALGACGFGA